MKALLLVLLLAFCAGCSPEPRAARPAFVSSAVVAGDSILPSFPSGAPVSVEHCRFSDLHAGDTVIFWHDGAKRYIHHRLVGRDQTGRWVTMGDNNPTVDRGHMTSDEFVGRTHKQHTP